MDDWGAFFARIGPQLRQMEQLRLVKYESYMRRRKISLRLAAVLTPVTPAPRTMTCIEAVRRVPRDARAQRHPKVAMILRRRHR